MRLRILTAEQLTEGYVRRVGIDEDGVKILRDRFEVVERYPDGRALVFEPTPHHCDSCGGPHAVEYLTPRGVVCERCL